MTDKMAALAKRIEALPGTQVDLTTFPSGAATLDVHSGDRLFVMAYFPSWKCFGVDEAKEDDGFTNDYQFVSKEFEPAAERLWGLVTEAGPCSPDSQPGKSLAGIWKDNPDIDQVEEHIREYRRQVDAGPNRP